MKNDLFQALHSPFGANAAFAVGLKHGGGGFSLERDRVPTQDIYIGYQDENTLKCFPFYKIQQNNDRDVFVQSEIKQEEKRIEPIKEEQIIREFEFATDTFYADRITFSILNRIEEIADPEQSEQQVLKQQLMPAILSKLIIDNTNGVKPLKAFFAISDIPSKMFLEEKTNGKLKGVISKEGYGFAVVNGNDYSVIEAADFKLEEIISKDKPSPFVLGSVNGLVFHVEPGKKCSIDIAMAWYLGGDVTDGLHKCRYYYTEFYQDILEVLVDALALSNHLWEKAFSNNILLKTSALCESQKFLIAQAVKSYYISSMLFIEHKKPRWVMNEGTFRMMNTFDLTIDHTFFDFRYHPWVVRNQLDSYWADYSYKDQCGISFTHDQGFQNIFTRKGYSSYEIPNVTDCFSYMTQEQLCNWILAAGMYQFQTKDFSWLKNQEKIIMNCLRSMCARDGDTKDGIMDIDSYRCGNGAEITTYDSLDTSLGQARRNLYIAVKCWASYIALETMIYQIFDGETQYSKSAKEQAKICAATINSYFDNTAGYFPAIFDGDTKTAIIPAVEGLIYPYKSGREDAISLDGEYKELIHNLKRHLQTVLDSKKCLFADGGWKLSESSYNSWISKIFLCQDIAERILNVDTDMQKAHQAHESWWKVGCPTNPGIDQIFAGQQAERGFHYPRAVTSILWLD